MNRTISLLTATALITSFAAADASFAASKKSKAPANQAENCLGGGCVGVNPDRVRPDYYSSYYKRSTKTKKTSGDK
jgi:hypothetical protein